MPDATRPISAAELCDALRLARSFDPSRLDRVLRVDEDRGLVEVQAGATWRSLAAALRPDDPRAHAARTTAPTVGESIARAIRDILARGRLAMLERLRGESDPAKLLASVPGIGRATADRPRRLAGPPRRAPRATRSPSTTLPTPPMPGPWPTRARRSERRPRSPKYRGSGSRRSWTAGRVWGTVIASSRSRRWAWRRRT